MDSWLWIMFCEQDSRKLVTLCLRQIVYFRRNSALIPVLPNHPRHLDRFSYCFPKNLLRCCKPLLVFFASCCGGKASAVEHKETFISAAFGNKVNSHAEVTDICCVKTNINGPPHVFIHIRRQELKGKGYAEKRL